jgi:transcription elongation factor Elf1
MSKRIEATITCPKCSFQFNYTLFRTIWGEHEANKNLVLSDKINVATCPSCGTSTKLQYPFMYVDVDKKFAVWWEPYYDAQIDSDSVQYAKMFGEGNFYHKAPRIKDWHEFKSTVLKYDSGELKANPLQISNDQKQAFEGALKGMIKDLEKKNKKNSGCLGVFVFLIGLSSLIVYGVSKII